MAKAKRGGFEETLKFLTPRMVKPNMYTGVKIKIVTERQFASTNSEPWSSVRLDDGHILMATLIQLEDVDDETRLYGASDAESKEWAEDTRRLRNKLLAFMEADPDVSYLEMEVGGDGRGFFRLEHGAASIAVSVIRRPDL